MAFDYNNSTLLGYGYDPLKTKTDAEIQADTMAWFSTQSGSTGIRETREKGVWYDIDTGAYYRSGTTSPAATTPTASAATASASSGGGSGGGVSTPTSIYKAPEVKAPEPFRATVKTGQEVGGDFKLFKGAELGDKSGLTADRLRIGGAGSNGQNREIKKKKQLDTLGLNVASAVGLGI